EYGAATQLEKIDMLDFADIVVLNKFDKRGAPDALRDVRKQYQRNRQLWSAPVDDMPVFGTIASQFNDPGTNHLYAVLMEVLSGKTENNINSTFAATAEVSEKVYVIPPERTRYLSEISENNRRYDRWAEEQGNLAQQWYAVNKTLDYLASNTSSDEAKAALEKVADTLRQKITTENIEVLKKWEEKKSRYKDEVYTF